MQGENDMGLRKIIDLTRMLSILILLLHFYYYCYGAFDVWGYTNEIGFRLLSNLERTGLFKAFHTSKFFSLLLLIISLIGARGKKNEKLNYRTPLAYLITGIAVYFASGLCFHLQGMEITSEALCYMGFTGLGFVLVLSGGTSLTRVLKQRVNNDVFNKENQSFPQDEQLLTNPYSINLPAEYTYRGKQRKSWINLIAPRRSVLLLGGPGSGKSYYWVENIIRQTSDKLYVQMVFDFKFPELSTLTYNYYLKNRERYPVEPAFCCVSFTRPIHRINPLSPGLMKDMIDAIDASKTLLLAINKTWTARQGEFFVESPINLLAAVIWFLRKYQNGKYCTLPHAIELLQLKTEKLFTILNYEPEIQTLINNFIESYLEDNMETIDSQMASVKVPLGRLSAPSLYYILSGDDFTLDINNSEQPKIFCLGNDPAKSEALAPVLSLIIDRMNKVINQPGGHKCLTIYDEASRIRATSLFNIVAQGRSNDLVCVLALQDYSQLKQIYTREEAEALFNMCGNVIAGQVSGETAKLLAERFPKIMQDRESISINRTDTSISRSKQLEASIPASTISTLSSGEFVGVIADNPDQPIEIKVFHKKVINDHDALRKEKAGFKSLPFEENFVSQEEIFDSFLKIKEDVLTIQDDVLAIMLNDPTKEHLIVKK